MGVCNTRSADLHHRYLGVEVEFFEKTLGIDRSPRDLVDKGIFTGSANQRGQGETSKLVTGEKNDPTCTTHISGDRSSFSKISTAIDRSLRDLVDNGIFIDGAH